MYVECLWGPYYFLIKIYIYYNMSELFSGGGDEHKKTFFSHVFSTTEEGKAEILNVVQYATLGVIPIVFLNKLIQRFIPEADLDKSTIELLAEIFIQLIVMFCGVIVIHRIITFIPTYSGFKYENLVLTNVILAFLILVLSIQTKMGIKTNILVDRVSDMWNGADADDKKKSVKKGVKVSGGPRHAPSQADYIDDGSQSMGAFPPAAMSAAKPQNGTYDQMTRGSAQDMGGYDMGPSPANGVLGGSFGSFF